MKTLIVIDMQNDFIDGALGTPEAVKIVPKVKEKIQEYVNRGDRIIFTQDTHTAEHYFNTQEGKLLPVMHCIKNTDGWLITDKLFSKEMGMLKGKVVYKNRFGYEGWRLMNLDDSEEIEIVGLCTDICVVANAMILKATYPEIKMKVDSNCCAGTTPDAHEAALTVMRSCQIEVI